MKEVNNANSPVTQIVDTVLQQIANLFAGMPCSGVWFEPKVPEKIKK